MRTLYTVLAHIDDLEFATLGYILNSDYDRIVLITCTTWEPKEGVFQKNLEILKEYVNIEYVNLKFPQRLIPTYFDEIKDRIYKEIDFSSDFDILTHDAKDAHTDHTSVYKILFGIYKYCNRFVTVYSPEMVNFTPNFFIEMDKEQLELKKKLLANYNFNEEQSYAKKGYYFQEDRIDLPTLFALDMFHNRNLVGSECYKIYKWLL